VDAENTHQICLALNEAEPALSPTRFHNSVQNAVSGYWTIVTGSRAPTTMVMGGDGIFAIGLLEAMVQAAQGVGPVLLVVFDVPMPEPLFSAHPIEGGGAVALVLDGRAESGPLLSASLESTTGPVPDGALPDVPLSDSPDIRDVFHALRGVHPVGAALPLLASLARSGADTAGGTVGSTRLALDRYHALQVAIEA
jgi:hypothetical protein